MAYLLPPLPFEASALSPWLSPESIEIHYERYHREYVDRLNEQIGGTSFEKKSLEEFIFHATGDLFNHAAQAWNHTFYWNCLVGKWNPPKPDGALLNAIVRCFGSVDGLKREFYDQAVSFFGSGWIWLVKNQANQLYIVTTQNANNPILKGLTPVLVCDLWEHAYTMDYLNLKSKYLEGFMNYINWNYVNRCYMSSEVAPISQQMSASIIFHKVG